MGASLSGFVAKAPAPPAEAPPATKRPRPASGKDASFTRVLEAENNVTTILAFAGYRTVLTLETLCPRARRVVRGARVELDVSQETDLTLATMIAMRGELFEARRAGVFKDVEYTFDFNYDDWSHRAADVVYRGDRPLLLSPPPRGAAVDGLRGGADCDKARSACAVAAVDRRRAALLSIGFVSVELGTKSGDVAGVGAMCSLAHRHLSRPIEIRYRRAKQAVPAELLDAMGGIHCPRRLVEAAERREAPLQEEDHATRVHLDRAIRQAARASVVLDEPSLRRILVLTWKYMSENGWPALSEAVFEQEVCGPAGVGATAAVWEEVRTGVLLPLMAVYTPAGSTSQRRAEGDVRCGDVVRVACYHWFWPAISAFALTSLARDAALCFSQTHSVAASTFETFVIRQTDKNFKNCNGVWSAALAVLDDLATRRDGEPSDEAGKQRWEAAIQPLLGAERLHTLAVNDEVEFAVGDPDGIPVEDDLEWTRGTIVRIVMHKAVVRVGEDEREVYFGQLRLVEERPCPAVILLAHAVADHRNGLVRMLMNSERMSLPLSYVVGEPGKAISVRTDKRCTALDHAIVSKNFVAIGMFWAAYAEPAPEDYGGAWRAVRATCRSLIKAEGESTPRSDWSPTEQVSFKCALRSAPGPYREHLNAWRAFEVQTRNAENLVWDAAKSTVRASTLAVINDDIDGVRRMLARCVSAVRRAHMISRPWQVISLLWRTDPTAPPDPRDSALAAYEITLRAMLMWACKCGRLEILREILRPPIPITLKRTWMMALISIAEGHTRCLELLLSSSTSRQGILSCFASDAPSVLRQHGEQIVLQAVDFGDSAAIDSLRLAGVPLVLQGASFLERSPLEDACRSGQPESVRALLRDPAVCLAVQERRSECFHWAADNGNASCLAVLFETFTIAQAKAESDVFGRCSILTLAAVSDDWATVQILLGQPGIDVDEKPPGLKSALCVAGTHLNYLIASALLARGAVVGLPKPSRDAQDVLDYALDSTKSGRVSFVRLILRERQRFTLDLIGYVKRHWVRDGTLAAFLDDDANLVSQPDDKGLTPLHIYVYHATIGNKSFSKKFRMFECIELLIVRGADLDAKTTSSITTDSGDYLFCGANHPVQSGMTPMDIARDCGVADRRPTVIAAVEAAIKKRDAAAAPTMTS